MRIQFHILFALAALAAASARADWQLQEHNQEGRYVLGTDYAVTIEYGAPRIAILLPSDPGYPYYFDCHDSEPPYDPAPISGIVAASDLGEVRVRVMGYGGRAYGASDIWAIQIRQDSGQVIISGPVTAGGSIVIGRDLNAGRIEIGSLVGSIDIGRDVSGGQIELGSLSGAVTVERDVIEDGQIEVTGDATGAVLVAGLLQSGEVAVNASLVDPGQITISASIMPEGRVLVGQDVSGKLIAAWAVFGGITVEGQVLDGGEIVVDQYLHGALTIDGDLGAAASAGSVFVGDLVDGGHIIVNGSLRAGGDITLGGTSGEVWDDEFVTVGYDGYDGDEWFPPAVVTIASGPQAGTYDWNTPEHNVYLVRCLRGDLDNSEAVDYADIDIYAENIWGEPDPQAKYCSY